MNDSTTEGSLQIGTDKVPVYSFEMVAGLKLYQALSRSTGDKGHCGLFEGPDQANDSYLHGQPNN